MANSINTNASSFTALRNLNSNNSRLGGTQSRIGTGQRVSDALTQAASFTIGQILRAELSSSNAISQGLGNSQGVASVAIAGTTAVSDQLGDIRAKLIELSNPAISAGQKQILQNDFDQLVTQVRDIVANSSFNGTNLLEAGATDLNTLANDAGGTVSLSAQSQVDTTLAALQAASGGDPLTILQNEFAAVENAANSALGDLGAGARQLAQQDRSIQAIRDATEEGLGNIVDADLGREAARLAAQQVQSQLSTVGLGIANSQPNTLLGLFR